MIRKAKPNDAEALTGLVMRALHKLDIGDVVVSRERITLDVRDLISNPQCFVMVHELQGIDGAIVVSVADSPVFERKSAGIVFWYATVPGSGYLMLRRAVQWSKSRPAIKALGLSMDFGGDERIGKLLERVGIKRRGSVFARY